MIWETAKGLQRTERGDETGRVYAPTDRQEERR